MKFIIACVMAIAMLSFVPPSEAGCRGCRKVRVARPAVRQNCDCGKQCACSPKRDCGKQGCPVQKKVSDCKLCERPEVKKSAAKGCDCKCGCTKDGGCCACTKDSGCRDFKCTKR